MAVQRLSVVCAWCNRLVTAAPAGAALTHTICPSCLDWAVAHPASRSTPHIASDLHLASDLYELRSEDA
jgi:hypothetical protein